MLLSQSPGHAAQHPVHQLAGLPDLIASPLDDASVVRRGRGNRGVSEKSTDLGQRHTLIEQQRCARRPSVPRCHLPHESIRGLVHDSRTPASEGQCEPRLLLSEPGQGSETREQL